MPGAAPEQRWDVVLAYPQGFTLCKEISQRCLLLCNKLPHNLAARTYYRLGGLGVQVVRGISAWRGLTGYSLCVLRLWSQVKAQPRGDAVTSASDKIQLLSSKLTKGLVFCFLAGGLT